MKESIILEDSFIFRTDEHHIMVVKKVELPLISEYPMSYFGDMYLLENGELIKEDTKYEIVFNTTENTIYDTEKGLDDEQAL